MKNFLFSRNILAIFSNKLSKSLSKMNVSNNFSLNNNQTHIVWVDLEMTGLDINTDHIIEMACLITDKDLNIVAQGPELIINQSDHILNTMNDWCKKVHGESGLTESVRKSKINIQEAESLMLEFIQSHVPKGKCPLAGNSIHVDRMFLNKYMKNFVDHLHYRIIDVSTIKELSMRWKPSVYYAKNNPHRALDDIKESIQELKFYRNELFKV